MGRALVLGYGESGRAAEQFLRRRGWSVVVADQTGPDGGFLDTDLGALEGVELVVASPGVAPSQCIYREALARGLPVIGEVELACRALTHRAVGITGTNGKTTVTLMVAHVLNRCGVKAVAVGNVGTPLTKAIDSESLDTLFVVELSSWQLETIGTKVFDAAVVLNITPDHLDRHVTMASYAAAKAKIQDAVKDEGSLYLHADVVRQFGDHFRRSYELISKGKTHHQENQSAAFALCSTFGVGQEQFCRAVEGFTHPPHRMEFIGQYSGINYIDDSKGTNVDAVVKAIESLTGQVILIVGGVDKQGSYQPWLESFPGRVKAIFAIGQAANGIQASLQPLLPVLLCSSLEEAVRGAVNIANAGDTVLLSPGCASYDMFKNYKHRGIVYRELVHKLCEQKEGLL